MTACAITEFAVEVTRFCLAAFKARGNLKKNYYGRGRFLDAMGGFQEELGASVALLADVTRATSCSLLQRLIMT
jgi:hypothetical protein